MEAPPNTNVCPICLGFPGVLPVLNEKALEQGIKIALALNCTVNRRTMFFRKHYFYPDLPKGYQITQSRTPLGTDGFLTLSNKKKIRIRGVHIEEESGKSLHEGEYTLIDFNRAGIPLCEIVTEPDMETPEEAAEFVEKLQLILRYLDISEARMEKGELRCEPNISITGEDGKPGVRCEIKNLNSIKNLRDGIRKELERQRGIMERGEEVKQVTLLWDESLREVKIMRLKETSADYRYMPEPDLPPLYIEESKIEEISKNMGELPEERMKRFMEMGLTEEQSSIMVSNRDIADFFEKTVEKGIPGVESFSWIQNVLLGIMRTEKKNIGEIDMDDFIEILKKLKKGEITSTNAKLAIHRIVKGEKLKDFIKDMETTDTFDLDAFIDRVIEDNPDEVRRYREGKKGLIGFFIGQVMKMTKGKANPEEVRKKFLERLEQ